MTDYLFFTLVQQLQRCRTWIDVQTPELRYEFYVICGGTLVRGLFRVLMLICCKSRNGYDAGQYWLIPEFDIDDAIKQMQSDSDFCARLKQHIITTDDAEQIIKLATYGIIDPELKSK